MRFADLVLTSQQTRDEVRRLQAISVRLRDQAKAAIDTAGKRVVRSRELVTRSQRTLEKMFKPPN